MKGVNKSDKELEHNKKNDPVEKCVICGADTPYRFSTPISQREFYIGGAGQMCKHCHYESYIKKNM